MGAVLWRQRFIRLSSLVWLEPWAEVSAKSVRAFLRPVDLPALGIDGDSNAPSRLVAAVSVATARLDERLNLRRPLLLGCRSA
jgi:hypothetical protein